MYQIQVVGQVGWGGLSRWDEVQVLAMMWDELCVTLADELARTVRDTDAS